MSLEIVHVELAEANELVGQLHRHHKPVRGHRYSIGARSEGRLVGAAIVGRPVSREVDWHTTVELTRLVTDGTPNVCSLLYAAAARAAKELGYQKIQTYILDSEPGTSLRAAGWSLEGRTAGGDWNDSWRQGRRTDQPMEPKQRWSRILGGRAMPVSKGDKKGKSDAADLFGGGPGGSHVAEPTAPMVDLDLFKLANDLVGRRQKVRGLWNGEVQNGLGRKDYDDAVRVYIQDMYAWYHKGGEGCPLERATEQKCLPNSDAVPLCWNCAGGKGLPPEPEEMSDEDVTARDESSSEAPDGNGESQRQPQDRGEGSELSLPRGSEGLQGGQPTEPEVPGDGGAGLVRIRISAIGHCRREVGATMRGDEESDPAPEHWKVSAWLGGLAEQIMVKTLENRGYTIKAAVDEQDEVSWEWKGETPFLFRGHPDGDEVDLNHDPTTRNLEMKCLGHDRADAIEDQGVRNATIAYYDQVQGYMRAKGQKQTLFVVMDRDKGFIREYTVDFDPERWKQLVDRWREVIPIITAGELPEPDYNGKGFPCIVCAHRSGCPAWQKEHRS